MYENSYKNKVLIDWGGPVRGSQLEEVPISVNVDKQKCYVG